MLVPEAAPCCGSSSDAAAPDAQAAHVLDELVRAHWSSLRQVARRMCRNHADAEDLLQDTFERAARHAGRIDAARGWSWLVTVLRNLHVDQQRRRQRQLVLPMGPHDDPAQPAPEPKSPSEQLDLGDLRAAVRELDPEFRVVYEMYALSGCTYEHIAEVLQLPRSTIGTRLLRARRKLRALLARRLDGELVPPEAPRTSPPRQRGPRSMARPRAGTMPA